MERPPCRAVAAQRLSGPASPVDYPPDDRDVWTPGEDNWPAPPAPRQGRSGLGSAYVPARDDVEARLVDIWEELLEIRPVGVRDNFFEAGGDSLLAVDLVLSIRKEFGKEL